MLNIVFGMPVIFWILAVITYSFTLVNGFHDGCNAVATLIASRSMKPKTALIFAGTIELIGPLTLFATGFGVSRTIQNMITESTYIGNPEVSQQHALAFIAAGIIAAITWNLITWVFGIPSSSTHALIGGVVGSGIAAFGFSCVNWTNFFTQVVLMIFLAPMLGFGVGYVIMKLLKLVARHMDTKANNIFKHMQTINMVLLSYSHSTHDSQKSIGIILLLMAVAGHPVENGATPPWPAVLVAGICMACGILFGGYSIIKTIGLGIYKVRPIHSYASQLTAAGVLLTANALHVPVSASHVVTSSIMGVGSAERINAVRWSNVRNVIISWFITLPIVGTLGALLYFIFSLLLK